MVLLPAPFDPASRRNFPRHSLRSIPFKAMTGPNCLLTCFSLMASARISFFQKGIDIQSLVNELVSPRLVAGCIADSCCIVELSQFLDEPPASVLQGRTVQGGSRWSCGGRKPTEEKGKNSNRDAGAKGSPFEGPSPRGG